jgi:alpha-tubulin suppressor-like RCC1 family protein
MNMNKILLQARWAASALLVANLLACGGGGSSGGAGAPSSVVVTPAAAQDYWGYDLDLSAEARDTAGALISAALPMSWSSSDTSIATVGGSGLVSLLRPGSVSITASNSGVSGAATVNVLGLARLARGQETTMCALNTSRQRIFCWGSDGTTTSPIISPTGSNFEHQQPAPIAQGAIPAGATIAKVVLSLHAACALTDAGTAYCWGENQRGVLGSGDNTSSTSPRAAVQGAVPAGVKFVDIAASAWTVCAAGDDGNIYCWGANTTIPNTTVSSTGNSLAPVANSRGVIPAGVKINRVALSTNVGCGLGDDGNAYCWKVGAIAPAPVAQGERPVGSAFTEIQIGADLACGLAANGEAYCWGSGFGKRFGAGSAAFISNAAPTRVVNGARPSGARLVALSVGGVATASCAVADNGVAYCWGTGYRGSLGDGNLADHDALTPVAVLPGEKDAAFTWTAVNCAQYACSALANDGRVYSWGSNEDLMLSRDATVVSSATPLLITRVIRP